MMKPPHILNNGRRCRLMAGCHLIAMVAVVLVYTGCSGAKREEDGDKDPLQSSYFVDITPGEKEVVIPSGAGSVQFSVHLSVKGIGKDLPPDINTFQPAWVGQSTSPDDVVMTININDPNSPQTDATIHLNAVNLQAITNLLSDLSGEPFRFFAKFRPSKVPKGLKVTGQTVLPIRVSTQGIVPQRTEKTNTEPILVVSPGRAFFQNPNNAHAYNIVYHGPPADLTFSISGTAAPQFSVSAVGGSFPYPLDNGSTPILTVTRTSDAIFGNAYLLLTAKTRGEPSKTESITVQLLSL
jgi:hypothetical protein